MTDRNRVVAVIGSGTCSEQTELLAQKIGALLAKQQVTVICGGLSGVMQAVCRGAKNNNGCTIGVLPGSSPQDANPYIDICIATGMGQARNLAIVQSADTVIAVDGAHGTLSEIAFALRAGKTVIGLNTWDIQGITAVSSPEEAVDLALQEDL